MVPEHAHRAGAEAARRVRPPPVLPEHLGGGGDRDLRAPEAELGAGGRGGRWAARRRPRPPRVPSPRCAPRCAGASRRTARRPARPARGATGCPAPGCRGRRVAGARGPRAACRGRAARPPGTPPGRLSQPLAWPSTRGAGDRGGRGDALSWITGKRRRAARPQAFDEAGARGGARTWAGGGRCSRGSPGRVEPRRCQRVGARFPRARARSHPGDDLSLSSSASASAQAAAGVCPRLGFSARRLGGRPRLGLFGEAVLGGREALLVAGEGAAFGVEPAQPIGLDALEATRPHAQAQGEHRAREDPRSAAEPAGRRRARCGRARTLRAPR